LDLIQTDSRTVGAVAGQLLDFREQNSVLLRCRSVPVHQGDRVFAGHRGVA
jgi:hypothetical protein